MTRTYAQMPHVDSDRLTDRHFEIILLVAEGFTNEEIAPKLFISAQTVKSHIKTIYKRTGATSRAHLVSLAYRMGAVTSPGVGTGAYRPLTPTEEEQIARKIYAAVLPDVEAVLPWNKLSSRSRERCRSAARIAVLTRNEQLRGSAR